MLRVSFLVLLSMALAATSVHARSDLFAQLLTSNNQLDPYPECVKIPFLLCDRVCDSCVCDRRAPQLAECTCSKWKPVGQVPEKTGCQKIPFLLCDRVCDACGCDRRVPWAAECSCGKWKPIDEELQKSEKLSTELDVVAKPVAKSVGGFIPYPECIEKCDECVICTQIYPIEAALCYCGKKTEAKGRALPI